MLTTESLFVSSVLNKEDGVPGDKAPPGTFYLTPM